VRSHFGWLLLLASIQEIPAALAAANGSGLVALALHAGASACAAGWLGRRLHGEVTGWSFALPFACALFVPRTMPAACGSIRASARPISRAPTFLAG